MLKRGHACSQLPLTTPVVAQGFGFANLKILHFSFVLHLIVAVSRRCVLSCVGGAICLVGMRMLVRILVIVIVIMISVHRC